MREFVKRQPVELKSSALMDPPDPLTGEVVIIGVNFKTLAILIYEPVGVRAGEGFTIQQAVMLTQDSDNHFVDLFGNEWEVI